MQETDVCIGDVFQLGEAVVQVSQPRQPCHKLGLKHDWPDLPLRVQSTGFTGYYVRVLQEGFVDKHSPIRLLQRHPKGITVSFVNHIKYHEKENKELFL
jgi:MOSC domain-containing protein YiiM